jgi:hypothetical protein
VLARLLNHMGSRAPFALDLSEDIVELAPEGGVHRVHRLRAIEHEVRDVVLRGEGEGLHGGRPVEHRAL